MHKVIHSSAAARRHIQRQHAVSVGAAPSVRKRQISTYRQDDPGIRGAARHAQTTKTPYLLSPSRAHQLLPRHDALTGKPRAYFLDVEERYVNPLQLRLSGSLLDPQCYDRLAPELCDMLVRTGLSDEEAASLVGSMLALLLEHRPLHAIEKDVRALIDTMMIAGHPELTVEVALQHQLMLRVNTWLTLLGDQARKLPGAGRTGIDWGAALLNFCACSMDNHLDIRNRLHPAPLVKKPGDSQLTLEPGRYEAVFSLDMLHRSPDLDANLRQIHDVLQPGGRVVALETVLVGDSEKETECERGRTLVHDYLLHFLLRPGTIPVNGNYLRQDEWPTRLRQNGFKVCEVIELDCNEASPGNREALYIAEKAS